LRGAVLKANRFTMEEPIGSHQGTKQNHCFPLSQVRKESDYRLIKELWAFTGNRITVRCAYEWHDDSGHSYMASMAMENWEFNDDGLMALRFASINDFPILKSERKYH
jgi:nuclear transport factor 2 (NTF2) superfamily protein